MKLYLGEGAREYLSLIEEAAKAWNDVLGREVIEVSKDPVHYPYHTAPEGPSREIYSDGASVIYFRNRYDSIGGYARTTIGNGNISESDVFIWTRRGIVDGIGLFGTIMHELGHTLGLGHISISGSIMSYSRGPALSNGVDPFVELELLPQYDYNKLAPGEVSLFFSRDHKALLKALVKPSEQDKYALMCLYDFSEWEE